MEFRKARLTGSNILAPDSECELARSSVWATTRRSLYPCVSSSGIPQRRVHLFRRDRQLPDARAYRVIHRVRDRRGDGRSRHLADCLDVVGTDAGVGVANALTASRP